jgi:hypothetical protein
MNYRSIEIQDIDLHAKLQPFKMITGYVTLSNPLDSSIGLSLLVAEVTKPPFGGTLITFSETPSVITVGGEQDSRGFIDKVRQILLADWGQNTDFVKVFESLVSHTYLEDADLPAGAFAN